MAAAAPVLNRETRGASAEAAAAAAKAADAGDARLRDMVAEPSSLGIDMAKRTWFKDALHWGLAFRSSFHGGVANADGSFTLGNGARVRMAETAQDFKAIDWFVRSLAVYEKAPDDPELSPESFMRDGTGPSPAIAVLVASMPAADAGEALEEGGATLTDGAADGYVDVAFAMYTTAYSSWRGRCLYLEDLYVVPTCRRAGVGTELIRVGAAGAEATRCPRMAWVALNWNEPALNCYDKMGAERQVEWTTLWLKDEQLGGAALA